MKKIYLKNYKGFKNQIINFSDVNFLVGENSTGKTSILKIINLLCDNNFWYDLEFNNNQVELGYFDEIIDKNSREKKFEIGFEKMAKDDDNNEDYLYRILCQFSEENSVPKLSLVKTTILDYDVLIKFTDKQLIYRIKENHNPLFDEWVNDFDFPVNYKSLGSKPVNVAIPYLILFIGYRIKRDINSKSKGRSFNTVRLFNKYLWLAPIRAKAKRIYDSYKVNFSPEGEHIPSLLRQLITKKSKDKKRIVSILESFGKDSNLFDEIDIKDLGKKSSSPFEIFIKYNNVEIKLHNVGYGVSQSLPLIIEILASNDTYFSIQQPEVHLHPRAQAAFGSFLFNSVLNDSNKFIIETHSEYTINRFRYKLSKSKDNSITSKILFFERGENGNDIKEISINNDGSYDGYLPQSYRDFFIDEELKLLEL